MRIKYQVIRKYLIQVKHKSNSFLKKRALVPFFVLLNIFCQFLGIYLFYFKFYPEILLFQLTYYCDWSWHIPFLPGEPVSDSCSPEYQQMHTPSSPQSKVSSQGWPVLQLLHSAVPVFKARPPIKRTDMIKNPIKYFLI